MRNNVCVDLFKTIYLSVKVTFMASENDVYIQLYEQFYGRLWMVSSDKKKSHVIKVNIKTI